jgi:hypothetical protein
MEKKDIYEHLAKIYLDTPAVSKKKFKEESDDYKLFIFIGIAVVFVFSIFFLFPISRPKNMNPSTNLVLISEPLRFQYKFDPTKKEVYSFDMKKLNLTAYKNVNFSIKKSNYNDVMSIRVELNNVLNEKSEIYLKDITNQWKEYKLQFADFKSITQWSEMSGLSFIIEEWNTKQDSGVVFIDNVRFSK